MSNFNFKESIQWRNLFTRSALILITVALIVWLLPRNASQQFHYDIDKPWMYNSFIASFDFPVYKTDEAIQEEKDSLLQYFQPYFNYRTQVEKQQIDRFKNDFKVGIPGLPTVYLNILLDRLHRLYQQGIINTPEYNRFGKDSTSMVRVVSGKQVQSLQINCINSTLSAYEQLFNDAKLMPYRQLLQRCNLNEYIQPNMDYDKERSETELNDLLSGIAIASGMVISGQKIIDRGDIVNEYTYRVLNSFEREMQRRNVSADEMKTTFYGQLLYVTILVLLFTIYLSLFRKDYFNKPSSITMLYVLVTIFPIIVSLMIRHNLFSIYILPLTTAAIFVRMFMDSRTAFVTHCTIVLICAAAVKYQYEFIIMQIVAGMVAIYSLRELTQRSQVFKTAILVGLSYIAVYFSLQLMQNSSLNKLDADMYYHFVVNAVLLLLAYPLMFIIEKMFGFTSNVTLFELSNTNRGILRNLSEIAPGTFQHSITVANLAAEIANKIEANSLMVRTGALYHDIGKMTNPAYFTENQVGANPHIGLSPKESARIIISHVTEGVKLAEQNNLPSFIKDFILTHHGTSTASYFYIQYKNDHPDEEVDPAPFSYPGPNPFTREQAILMMADSVEAASRSLPEYTEESITELTNRIIDGQLSRGAFVDCPITFRDVLQAKQVLIERLKAIYHTRISYPQEKK
ncbi:hydrolase [Prevotella sp. TCVGH]|uniref:HD family phosphohydrolase n=1 Tax=Prevotella sp. TCVGH TaxID=2182433 RepID=UPI00201D4A22|nr:HDIG domain-containing metalloprotein [Prevotella sp. TCVGH]MCL6747862.1 hydrolase [Prevotella sp. TCVGH]